MNELRTLVIAHRGASGHAPENTAAAIDRAIALGADMVEVDVQVSKDDQLVLLHDRVLARTVRSTQHTPRQLRRLRIGDLTLEEIRRLDAGAWWGPAFAGEPLPSLADVLVLCQGRIGLNVELKTATGTAEERERLCRALSRALAARSDTQVLASSFDHELLRRLAGTAGAPPLGVLAARRDVRAGLATAEETRAAALHVPCACVTPALLETARGRGRRLFAYTTDDPRLMTRLAAAGVDGIFTNWPDRLLALLGRT